VSPADGSNVAPELPIIYIDLNDAWGNDMFSIDLPCSIESFKESGLVPHEGLRIKVQQEDLGAEAVIFLYNYKEGVSFLVAKLTEPLHEVPWV
jgi:hypothetical protein